MIWAIGILFQQYSISKTHQCTKSLCHMSIIAELQLFLLIIKPTYVRVVSLELLLFRLGAKHNLALSQLCLLHWE